MALKVRIENNDGRKSIYDPLIVLPRLEGYLKAGLTNIEVARAFGLAESTFYDWKDGIFEEKLIEFGKSYDMKYSPQIIIEQILKLDNNLRKNKIS